MASILSARISDKPTEIKATIGQATIGKVFASYKENSDSGKGEPMPVVAEEYGSVYKVLINNSQFNISGNQIIVLVRLNSNPNQDFLITEEIDKGNFKSTSESACEFRGTNNDSHGEAVFILHERI